MLVRGTCLPNSNGEGGSMIACVVQLLEELGQYNITYNDQSGRSPEHITRRTVVFVLPSLRHILFENLLTYTD